MKTSSRKVLLIVPSIVVAKGLESIFNDLGEFEVAGILPDVGRGSETRLRNIEADVIIIDPCVFSYAERANGRNWLSDNSDAVAVALQTGLEGEETLKAYDETFSLYDEPTTIIRKLRAALEGRQESGKTEGEELSAREKEILVCVAKGMLNKEIADQFNISIYTVITHRKNITRKTGIKTVAGLTVYALLNNLIDVGDFE
ncbi:MAG: response regulator transcription factor [Bacteroidales bacterium]|nr:response regulator transcription factor [Bacteroidales bacterium]MBR1574599.1 response regulator transcription factor [Bacteroidales bacterium]